MDLFPRRELKRLNEVRNGDLFQMKMAGKLIFALKATEPGLGGTTSELTIYFQDTRASDVKPALSYGPGLPTNEWVISYGSDYVFQSNPKSDRVALTDLNSAELAGALILRSEGPALRVPGASGLSGKHDIEYDIRKACTTTRTSSHDIAVVRPFSLCLRDPLNGKLEELLTFA